MTDDERAELIAEARAERVERGLPPFIQSGAVYRLLAAVIDANAQRTAKSKS